MKLEFGDYCCNLEGLTDKSIVVGPAPSSGFKRRIFLCSARNSLQVLVFRAGSSYPVFLMCISQHDLLSFAYCSRVALKFTTSIELS